MREIRFGDLYFEDREYLQVVLEPKGVDDLSWGKECGLSLRLIDEDLSIRFHYLCGREDLSPLLDVAGHHFRKEDLRAFLEMVNHQAPPLEVNLPELIGYLEECGKASFVSPRIKHYRLHLSTLRKRVCILTTKGLLVSEERHYTRFLASCVATSEDRLERGYEVYGYALPLKDISLNDLIRTSEVAGRRAELMLSSRRVKAGVMPVVLSGSAGGTMIHEAVGHGLEADHAEEGLSIYSGRLGERVASPLITVIDDPTLSPLYGSYRYDDEGTQAQKVVLIERGVLKAFLYDNYQALKWGKASNGRGRRESFRHIPIPRMSNTFIAKGETSAEEILKSIDRGLLVKKMGGGEVNPLTGDFVFEVREGYYVERGEVLFPVKGATLVGNGPKILETIDLVGDDLTFDPGTCGKDGQGVPVSDGQPTLRIPELIVGGEA